MTTTVPSSPARQRWSGWQSLLPAAFSALAVSLCFFPFGFWNAGRALFAWMGLSLLYLALRQSGRARDSFLTGYLFGLVLHFVGGYWLIEIGFLPYLCVAFIMSGWFGLFGLTMREVFRRLEHSAHPPSSLVAPLLFATLWVVLEWVRSLGAYAFPWFPLAATQVGVVPMVQLVAITGQWGLSFGIALVGGGIGQALSQPAQRARLLPLALLPIALFLYGSLVLPQEEKDEAGVRVAAAQGSYIGDEADASLQTYTAITRDAVRENGAPLTLVVWPETVVWDDLLRSGVSYPLVSDLCAGLQTPVLAGTTDRDAHGRYNSAVLVGARGEYIGRYDKIKTVPLGEFFPLRNLLGPIYAKYPVGREDLTPGTKPGVMAVPRLNAAGQDTGTVRFGTLICYDSAFGWRARQEARAGAQFLCIMTNDLWFGMTAGPLQHADLAILRAVETRRPIVRAATSGESRLIDAAGRVREILPLMQRGQIQDTLYPSSAITPYVRGGDWFVVVCAGLFTGLLLRYSRR